ncbi:Alkyltransferase-like DNA repair [Abortiporus biennis]
MDSAEFHESVYNVVRQIPYGKVTSYGHVAKLIGMPRHSRHVGQALKFVSPDTIPPIPWQRVISSSGTISSRGPGTTGAQRQKEALEAEGVEVSEAGRVNFGVYGWFPDVGTVDIGVTLEDEANDDDDT